MHGPLGTPRRRPSPARAVPPPLAIQAARVRPAEAAPKATAWPAGRPTGVGLAFVLAAACAGSPFGAVGGVATPVELLGGGFVRFEGQRMPMEAFLLVIRTRVRDAGGDAARLPAVHVRARPGLTSQPVDVLLRELRTAGVQQVVLG